MKTWALPLGEGALANVLRRPGAFDLVVVDSEETTAAQVRRLRRHGAIVLGYLSVGTIERYRWWYGAASPYRLELWGDWGDWYADEVQLTRLQSAALVGAVAAVSAALAAAGIGTPFTAGFFTACFAAYAAIGVLHGELLVLVWLGRPGQAVAIQAVVAGLALAVSFPGTLLVGIWVAPLVFLTVCPLGIALTRRIAGRAVAEGGYSFYRAAF